VSTIPPRRQPEDFLHSQAGVDELIYFPGIAQVDQVDLLAEAVTPG